MVNVIDETGSGDSVDNSRSVNHHIFFNHILLLLFEKRFCGLRIIFNLKIMWLYVFFHVSRVSLCIFVFLL